MGNIFKAVLSSVIYNTRWFTAYLTRGDKTSSWEWSEGRGRWSRSLVWHRRLVFAFVGTIFLLGEGELGA